MNEANETFRAASAIAAFDAIQVAFAALVKKGILSKAEAEQILMQAIETIKTGGAGDQAAELLLSLWKRFPSLSRHLGSKAIEDDRGYGHYTIFRPRGHRGAEQSDELASPQGGSINYSVRNKSCAQSEGETGRLGSVPIQPDGSSHL
jgi:hypothetical protein